MSFGLCNTPATFQRCMTVIFQDMVEDFMEVFLDDFLVFDAKFDFSDDCKKAFNILKEKLTTAPIIISLDWNMTFELMCDASDFAIGAVLGQRIDGKFKPIYYASKTLNNAQEHYTTTEKELLAVVFSFDKFRPFYQKLWLFLRIGPSTKERDFFASQDYFWEEHYAFKLCSDNIVRRCVTGSETLKILAHCHSGPTSGHHSATVTAKKVYESGFVWPSVFKDANEYIRRCDACQRSGNVSSRNEMPQNNI
nr:hypothetical protein [Tanacetum cinerariifolium]